MAKTHKVMLTDVNQSLAAALKKAADESKSPPVYCNHVQMSVNQNEFLLDFYRLGPDRVNPALIQAAFIQRIILPANILKSFSDAISATVEQAKTSLSDLEPTDLNP